MRTCNWYRFVVLCLITTAVLGILNIYFGVVPSQGETPCVCDCTQAIARQKSELKVYYEQEIETRDQKIKKFESASHVSTPVVAKVTDTEGEHRLAVLVPFRNRHEELQDFVPHIHQFLSRQNVHHEIWVINQADTYRSKHAHTSPFKLQCVSPPFPLPPSLTQV